MQTKRSMTLPTNLVAAPANVNADAYVSVGIAYGNCCRCNRDSSRRLPGLQPFLQVPGCLAVILVNSMENNAMTPYLMPVEAIGGLWEMVCLVGTLFATLFIWFFSLR